MPPAGAPPTRSPAARSARTAARIDGRRSASARQTTNTCRRTRCRSGTVTTPPGSGSRPSSGATHTPSPAATRLSWVWLSAARCATIGSTPLERRVNISHSWQNSPSPQVIHSSSASSARSISSRPASGWPAGRATSAGSSSSSALTSPSGSGIGLLYQSSTTARSRSPRTTPRMPFSGSSSRDRTRSAGWRSFRSASAAGNNPRAAVGKAEIRSSPATCPRCASRSAWASSTWDRMRAACSASSRPASVSRTPRPCLARSRCPTSRSSLAICCETAEVVMCSPSAAPLTEPCRARASRVRRRSRFNM